MISKVNNIAVDGLYKPKIGNFASITNDGFGEQFFLCEIKPIYELFALFKAPTEHIDCYFQEKWHRSIG